LSRAACGAAGLGVALGLALACCGGSDRTATASRNALALREVARPLQVPHVTVAQTGTLPAAVQDAAAAATGGESYLLMGGIDSAEASVAHVLRGSPTGATPIGLLPVALHDATACFLGGYAYLFGGGVVESFSAITRVSKSGLTASAGRLPTKASDLGSASIGETIYLVGGYTGQTALRTILAWRPGESARIVATLPRPLRYAAVAALGGQVMIVGGTSGETASRDVYRFDPTTGRLARVGLLPSPLTHAAAATVGERVYVFGGRSAAADGQTRRILQIRPNGEVLEAGLLPRALSDMAAVALAGKVLLVGGRDSSGRTQEAILTASIGRG
jgi:hypothetical protein